MTTNWVCAVSVATVWTSPEAPREIDQFGLEHPVQLNKWIEKMRYEELLDLCDGNRVQTQLLYGEPVIVDSIEGDWAKVVCLWQASKKDERGYPGWVPVKQLAEVEQSTPQQFARVKVGRSQLWTTEKQPLLVLSFNTILPVSGVSEEFTVVQTPHGEALLATFNIELVTALDALPKLDGEAIVKLALPFLDLPYFWGGMSSYGYDCSGFSYQMTKAAGYLIPRDASDQAVAGLEVNKDDQSEWQLGDLLFFANDEGTGSVRHVGIYSGNGQMIHSPSTGQSIEIRTLEGTKFVKELCAVRRFARVREGVTL